MGEEADRNGSLAGGSDRDLDAILAGLRRIPGLDVARGLRFARGQPRLYLTLLRGFEQDQRALPKVLRSAVDAGDHAAAMRAVHAMRGLASVVGATPLVEAGGELEQALTVGAEEREIRALLQLVAAEHRALFVRLAPLLAAWHDPASYDAPS